MLLNNLLSKIVPSSPFTWRKWSEVRKCSHLLTLSRAYSDNGEVPPVICKLKSRGLVRVKGADASPFLQGLVTNDVNLLEQRTKSLYTMLLNVQGRVQYDLILYDISHMEDQPTILLECDHSLVEQLVKDIKKYKIRKKVSIDPVEEMAVYAKLGQQSDVLLTDDDVIVQTEDYRVPRFASRLIATKELNNEDEVVYHEQRMRWGIPEGPADLPFGNCLPLECNLAYMNGVSFSKGCYLGQELTARTHHTGVIRKRIMPLLFKEPPGEIENGENIVNGKNKNIGKFRSCVGIYGLGLLRTAEVKGDLSVKTKTGESVPLTVKQPDWWPQE